MTYIPDVRKKMITTIIGEAPEENAYWEGYLDDGDKKWLKGFDWAADQVLPMIFDCIGDLDLEVEGEDMDLARFLTNHPEIREKMRDAFQEKFEDCRDELVVAMIEGYDPKKYDQLKKIADIEYRNEEKKKAENMKADIEGSV